MIEPPSGIPYALAKAYGDLVAALDEGIEQYNKNQQYTNSHRVCGCIERFVDALNAIPGGQEELRRRATLVEISCGPGSDYAIARELALSSFEGLPERLSGSRQVLSNLRSSDVVPISFEKVIRERRQIERVLDEGILKLGPVARKAFESWRNACRSLQRQAESLEVDGCWYLLHVHEAGEESPSEAAGVAKVTIQTRLGGRCLESIKAATESLMAWVTEAGRAASSPVKQKRSTERGEARTKLIAALTKHHQYNDGGCLHLEPVSVNELARRVSVSNSTASEFFKKEFKGHSNYRVMCTDASKLVAALKLLNQEWAPHLLCRADPDAGRNSDDD